MSTCNDMLEFHKTDIIHNRMIIMSSKTQDLKQYGNYQNISTF